MKIISLGDCNTMGVDENKLDAYPEKFAKLVRADSILNLGKAMLTTREGLLLYYENIATEHHIITIQFGLVDSWKTFKYSPYVLYYPDNWRRKIYRKLVKKYKKICRQLGLNSLFGAENVVQEIEYKENISKILEKASNSVVFLIDTVPNFTTSRNPDIIRYNGYLDELSLQYSNVIKINIYNDFLENIDRYYHDDTHINTLGHDYIASKLYDAYKKLKV